MRYLLDTNTCIAVMRKHPTAVQRMAATTPGDCAISIITSYELLTGVEKCSNPAKERIKVQWKTGEHKEDVEPTLISKINPFRFEPRRPRVYDTTSCHPQFPQPVPAHS